MKYLNRASAALAAVCFFAAPEAFAQAAGPQTFEVRPGGMSRVTFTSDAPLETIDGVSTDTRGSFTVDLAHPGTGLTGSVHISTASLRTGSDMRDEHLRSDNWLDAAHNPDITFTLVSARLSTALTPNTPVTGTLQGDLTVHGVRHRVTTPVTVRYVPLAPDMASMAQFGVNANMIRIQTAFHVNLSDYNVSIMAPLRLKVSNDIAIRVDVTAFQQAAPAAPAAH